MPCLHRPGANLQMYVQTSAEGSENLKTSSKIDLKTTVKVNVRKKDGISRLKCIRGLECKQIISDAVAQTDADFSPESTDRSQEEQRSEQRGALREKTVGVHLILVLVQAIMER